MKRGQIYYIESNHQEIGSEQRAGRPAVIVSNNKNNENSTTVEVVYMTTQPKNDLPTHVFIRSSLRPSTVLCEQIYSVSAERLGTYIGELTDRELQELDIALSISLGLDWMQPETSRGVPARRSGSYAAAVDRNRSKTGSSNRRTCQTEKPAGLQALVRPADREAA